MEYKLIGFKSIRKGKSSKFKVSVRYKAATGKVFTLIGELKQKELKDINLGDMANNATAIVEGYQTKGFQIEED
jgi:hypothetical protein